MGDPLPRLVVSLSRDFDVGEAWRVVRQIEGAVRGQTVVLDFTTCRQVDIFAASLLAHAVTREEGALQVRGLTRRDVRILEYLGVPTGSTGPGELPDWATDDDRPSR